MDSLLGKIFLRFMTIHFSFSFSSAKTLGLRQVESYLAVVELAGRVLQFLVMPGGAHREHEAAAGESNLQRFFDREFLAALRSDPAAPSKRAMLADFVASTIARLVSKPVVSGIHYHPSPTSSESAGGLLVMVRTASRTSGFRSPPPLAT